MTIHLHLPPELEQQLHRKATEQGVSVEEVIMDMIQEQIKQRNIDPDDLSEQELLARINLGWTEQRWKHYLALVDQRQEEKISAANLEELIRLTAELERLHAQRMPYLVALAKKREVSVVELIEDLSLNPAIPYA